MYAVEFKTKIKDGIIIIPEKYRKGLKENEASDIIEKLLDFPLKISDFKPMNREEIYDRI